MTDEEWTEAFRALHDYSRDELLAAIDRYTQEYLREERERKDVRDQITPLSKRLHEYQESQQRLRDIAARCQERLLEEETNA